MFYEGLFIIELISLFIASQLLTRFLSRFILSVTKSSETTIQTLFVVFFPGVMLHELAHWFVASVLFVPTGEIEFVPHIQGNFVKMGSVAIAKTDPIRRFIVGVAPILVGIICIASIFYFFSSNIPGLNWQTALTVYLLFEIGNTMYSSKKDMEGALVLFVTLLLLGISLFLFGIKIRIDIVSVLSTPVIVSFFKKIDILLAIPLGIDIFFWIFSFFFKK